MGLTARQKLEYYRQRARADKVILADARQDKHTIYGAKALNAQLPSFLQAHTEDFDIFTKTPKRDAYETEKKLDKAYKGDFFYVKKGQYPNTWKVKSRVTNKTVADYTYPGNESVPSKKIKGNKYAKIKWMEKKLRAANQDPKNAYRSEKDTETLQRINLNKDFLLG